MIKKIILLFTFILSTVCYVFSQSDQIFKHNNEVINANIFKITEHAIIFSYENETTEYTLSKHAVAKVIHGKSKREENISEKIIINGVRDWEKVVILNDYILTNGLIKGVEVKGKTKLISLNSLNSAERKSLRRIKLEAAKLNHPFIYFTIDETKLPLLDGAQSLKRGTTYTY